MSERDLDKLGTIVVKRYGTGDKMGEAAEIVSICNAPTFGLITTAGIHYNWRQDLTRPATEQEAAEYWKQRALKAETKDDRQT